MKSLEGRVSEEIARRTRDLKPSEVEQEINLLAKELQQSTDDCDCFTEAILDLLEDIKGKDDL